MKRSSRCLDLVELDTSFHAPKRQTRKRLEAHKDCNPLTSPQNHNGISSPDEAPQIFSNQKNKDMFFQAMLLLEIEDLMDQLEVTNRGQQWASWRIKEDVLKHGRRRDKHMPAHRRRIKDRIRMTEAHRRAKGLGNIRLVASVSNA
uniref:Uncharacterized protein n=1 Tax=Octactis speculum TaxID=3111310 RepID=A0A7S2E3X8_9STRA